MCGGGSKAPDPPPKLPEAAQAPEAPTDAAGDSASRDKRRRNAASGEGNNSTILTSSRGVTEGGQTANKTLLGV